MYHLSALEMRWSRGAVSAPQLIARLTLPSMLREAPLWSSCKPGEGGGGLTADRDWINAWEGGEGLRRPWPVCVAYR